MDLRSTSPNYTDPRAPIQQTLALIRPEAMCFREAITARIREAGFQILDSTIVKLTPEQAANLFADQIVQAGFPLKITSLCSGPVMALCLAKPEAVKEFQALMGAQTAKESRILWPGSLRAYFGSCGIQNGILGSVDEQHARLEIQFFFPHSKIFGNRWRFQVKLFYSSDTVIVDPVMSAAKDQLRYLNTFVYPMLMEGVYEIAKQQPEDPVLELAQWLWRHNPSRPTVCAFPVPLFDEIAAMKSDCRQWQMNRGGCGDSVVYATSNAGGDRDGRGGLSVIAEGEENEVEYQRCPLNI